jgi:hypothetical protein
LSLLAIDKDDFTLIQKILAGGASGALGSALVNPTDIVKVTLGIFYVVDVVRYVFRVSHLAKQALIKIRYMHFIPSIVKKVYVDCIKELDQQL